MEIIHFTAYHGNGELDAADYGHWTSSPYTLSGDDHSAIAYTIPLILDDGTVYGVLGVEILESYLQALLPGTELQNDSSGTYLLGVASNSAIGKDDLTVSVISASPAANAPQQSYDQTLLLKPSKRGPIIALGGRLVIAMQVLPTTYTKAADEFSALGEYKDSKAKATEAKNLENQKQEKIKAEKEAANALKRNVTYNSNYTYKRMSDIYSSVSASDDEMKTVTNIINRFYVLWVNYVNTGDSEIFDLIKEGTPLSGWPGSAASWCGMPRGILRRGNGLVAS